MIREKSSGVEMWMKKNHGVSIVPIFLETEKKIISPLLMTKVGILYLGRRKVMDRSLSLNQGPLCLTIQFF